MPNLPFAQQHIAIVGGGKMGEAILAGLLQYSPNEGSGYGANAFVVVNPGQQRRDYLFQTYRVACVESLAGVSQANVVVLAVKPQVMPAVLEQLAQQSWVANSLVVSIAAGISCASIEARLPGRARVVRVMPNTPLSVGCGVSAVCGGAYASAQDVQQVCALFQLLGSAYMVEEEQLHAVTALSGSGPAYVAAFVEALAQAGAQAGLDPSLAEQLVLGTVEGTAALMRESGQSAQEVREAVCSPGGTTVAALQAMDQAGYSQSIGAGVQAAIARSKELAQ